MRARYAFIGVPGSGKSLLAQAVEEALVRADGDCETCHTPVEIIDGIPEYIEENHKYQIGLDGGWLSSIAISMERYGRERKALHSPARTIISCSTLLESSVYMTMHFEQAWADYAEHERQDAAMRMESAMRFFASLYVDTFHYNRVFYLPPIEAPQDERIATLDKNFQAAFQAFNLTPVEPLMVEADNPAELTLKRVKMVLAPKENNALSTEREGTLTP